MLSETKITMISRIAENAKASNEVGLSKKNICENNVQIRPAKGLSLSENHANQGEGIKILLIGGDEYHQGLIRGFCQVRGCMVSSANDFSDATRKLVDPEIRAIITDLKTLRQNGEKMLDAFLSENYVQLFALLGEQWEIDQAGKSLRLKSNSFLVKPLDLRQLDDYLRDIIYDRAGFSERRKSDRRRDLDRRNRSSTEQPAPSKNLNPAKEGARNCVDFGIFCVDFFSKKATMADRTLDFTPKEFELFALFISHPGRVFLAEELIELAWSSRSYTTKADLYQYIYHIRHKIEPDPKHPQWLLTVRGFGYKFRED